MKTTTKGILAAGAVLLASATPSLAIEGLQISVQCPNVVLGWPSDPSETYIVQWRPDLNPGTAWVTLTNSLPGDWTTNWTVFVHSNQVSCSSGGTNSSSGGGGPPPAPGSPMLASTPQSLGPMVMRADGSGRPVPLCIYPPGFDLSRFSILDPATGDWVSGAGYTTSQLSLSRLRPAGPQPLDNDPAPPDPGFYQVVRVGPHFFGLTNGMVLSGQVSLPMEFGNTNSSASLDTLFLFAPDGGPVPGGITFPAIPEGISNGITAHWDTTVVSNGTYTFGVGAYLNDYSYSQYGMSMTEYDDNMITVQVSNPISWDGYGVGGDAFYVGAQTLYTNGTWTLDIYDNQNNLLAVLPLWLTGLPGPIDGNGYCAWPDPNDPTQPDPTAPFPGFSLSNLNANGNRLPYPSYTLVMTATAPGGGSSKTSTNIVAIEPAWTEWPSTTVISYQQLFAYASLAYDDEMAMVQAVAAIQSVYHPLVGLPLFNNLDLPFEITMGNGWASVTNALATTGTRDFYYFGHGSPASLGGGGLPAATIAKLLGNNAVTTNSHPYRFVFLDGCLTANGNFPQAFGILKIENMAGTDFSDKRGIRQRAFMGWDKTKIIGGLGAYWNDSHSGLVTGFYQNWQIRNPQTGYGQWGVKAAFGFAAATNSMSGGMKIYGSKDLIIDF